MANIRTKIMKNTILLVEDNSDDASLVQRALQKNKIDIDIVLAKDGAEALDYLFGKGSFSGRDTIKTPMLILLDLKLPKIDGLTVLERIRKDERTKLIPVIILTSSNEENDVIESYNKGATSYIRKSLDFDQFTEAIKQLQSYWFLSNNNSFESGGGI
jgi:CheY-like chemotaxis protein